MSGHWKGDVADTDDAIAWGLATQNWPPDQVENNARTQSRTGADRVLKWDGSDSPNTDEVVEALLEGRGWDDRPSLDANRDGRAGVWKVNDTMIYLKEWGA